MRVLSIDVATKSLAISYVQCPDTKTFKEEWEDIWVVKNWTVDLIPGRPSSTVGDLERVRVASTFTEKEILPVLEEHPDTIILIEEQLKTTPTYIVYITLLCLLRQYHKNIHIRGGSIKNKLSIGGIRKEDAYTKTIDKYKANKEHCRMMFLYIRDKMRGGPIVYNKKMETDLADTYIQLISFLSGF